ncbi:sensor histidine kinase [Timonella senegalensis]|uniref:sensor histidine kinase n=1 Tax=Timonella senegalensis TaxID=1465825 RepID=UPI0028ABCF41|nr:sensor histidine kinase [Timonella senegalensis]
MNVFERFGHWAEENGQRLDATLITITALAVVPWSAGVGSGFKWFFGPDDSGMWSAVFALFLLVPLAFRRSAPVISAVAVFAVALTHMIIGPSLIFPADLAVLVALYSITVYGPRWAGRFALFSSFAGAAFFGHVGDGDSELNLKPILISTFTLGLLFLTVWALGLMRRARLDSVRVLRERNIALELDKEKQAQIGAAAERSRIAREMHDIVAHSLSVIIAQADGGRYAAKVNPEMAEKTLTTISETGRAALADMRRLLGVLREDPNGDPDDDSVLRSPQPAAGDIQSLVDSMRTSGVRVSLVRMGTPRQLPPGAGLTLYRICQESLTNILKHAGPDPTVTVVQSWGRESVRLEIEDDGRGAASTSDGAGMGLLGMRERAALFGGTVKSGPRQGGGFRVELDLPLPELRE